MDFLDLNDLPLINRAWLFKDLDSLNLAINAKLAQSGSHQSRTQEIPGLIFSGGICLFCSNIFAIPYVSLS